MTDGATHALPHSAPPVGGLRVVVTTGRDAGKGVSVRAPVLIGTSELCELMVTDRTVSRRHILLEPSEHGVRVRDQKSRNGSWAGTIRIQDAELAVGSELRLGNTVLRIEHEAGENPVSPAGKSPARESFGRFVGSAPCLALLYALVERAAPTDATVLLEGESGTGKELLAEAIHDHSSRAERPLVVVDLGATPATLIESHLFGHEQGAFTGATRRHIGAFERANGGTLFLDEIGELPAALQPRLLRVLDRREVRRVGGIEDMPVDIRVVAATNRNLEREVEEKRFRLDLFHRLAVVLVRVPPLRERTGDIERLARHFVAASHADPAVLTDEVLSRLSRHEWPGNARELRNFVERLTLFGAEAVPPGSARTGADMVHAAATAGLPFRQARERAIEAFTDLYVADMLTRHGGNVSKAAASAGVARRYFQKLKERDE